MALRARLGRPAPGDEVPGQAEGRGGDRPLPQLLPARPKRRRDAGVSCELQEKSDACVKGLSGGQQQRLSLACALVGDPELLFLDEPTTGLDPQSRLQTWGIVEALKARGRTVLLTTHYMEEAARLCDRVAIVDHGKLIALGTPRELIASLGAEHVIEFAVDDAASAVSAETPARACRASRASPTRTDAGGSPCVRFTVRCRPSWRRWPRTAPQSPISRPTTPHWRTCSSPSRATRCAMPETARGPGPHPLVELTLARVRELVREPEAVFWVFVFPILLGGHPGARVSQPATRAAAGGGGGGAHGRVAPRRPARRRRPAARSSVRGRGPRGTASRTRRPRGVGGRAAGLHLRPDPAREPRRPAGGGCGAPARGRARRCLHRREPSRSPSLELAMWISWYRGFWE